MFGKYIIFGACVFVASFLTTMTYYTEFNITVKTKDGTTYNYIKNPHTFHYLKMLKTDS